MNQLFEIAFQLLETVFNFTRFTVNMLIAYPLLAVILSLLFLINRNNSLLSSSQKMWVQQGTNLNNVRCLLGDLQSDVDNLKKEKSQLKGRMTKQENLLLKTRETVDILVSNHHVPSFSIETPKSRSGKIQRLEMLLNHLVKGDRSELPCPILLYTTSAPALQKKLKIPKNLFLTNELADFDMDFGMIIFFDIPTSYSAVREFIFRNCSRGKVVYFVDRNDADENGVNISGTTHYDIQKYPLEFIRS